MRLHKFHKIGQWFPWLVCSECGLVTIRNKRTEKAKKQECVDRVSVYQMKVYDPSNKSEYNEALRRFNDS